MSIYKCSICGFTYNEAVGVPEKGIAPGTKWEDIPHDFVCPLCGAPKSAFEEEKEQATVAKVAAETAASQDEEFENLRELSSGELSALCSNLAKGCEKQHLNEEMDLFNQLADYYKSKVPVQSGKTLDDASGLLKTDLAEGFPDAFAVASAQADRGALRSLVWSEKVSRMLRSLFDRYAKEGDSMLENTKIFVCDICGFVYVGNDRPEICPVCKVPGYKISQIGRR